MLPPTRMWRWFTYDDENEESKTEMRMPRTNYQSRNGEQAGGVAGAPSPTPISPGRGARRSSKGMSPTYDELDPAVTAAILAQVTRHVRCTHVTAASVAVTCAAQLVLNVLDIAGYTGRRHGEDRVAYSRTDVHRAARND